MSKLRKPSVAAWAVNQLVRTQRREVDALLVAGDALQQAQADLLNKRVDAATLREAVEAERSALQTLTQKARGLLHSDGHELTPARLEQVTDTLHAAALDEDARARVRDGCLDRELRHVGLGALGASSAPSRPTRAKQKDARAGELEAARQAEAAARRALDRATKELHAAEGRRERAAEQLRDADDALAAARKQAAQAEREHKQARQRLERV